VVSATGEEWAVESMLKGGERPLCSRLRLLASHLRQRPHLLFLSLIVLIALALRLAWIIGVDVSPTDGRFDDTTWYHFSAVSIMEGRGYNLWFKSPPHCIDDPAVECTDDPPPTAYWNIGYPLLLAALYKVVGPSVFAAKLLNAVLGAATCLMAYLVGARVFDRRVGLGGALLLALFPGHIFFSALLMTETLSAFLLMLILTVALMFTGESASWRAIVLVGLLLGAASLVRGEMVLLFIPLIVFWAVAHRSAGKGIRYGAIALAAIAAVLLPWTIRNWIQLGYPVVLSTGAADNLLVGHWPGADGLGSFVPGQEVNMEYADVPEPEREVEVYKEETRRAVSYALHHPLRELELIPRKLFNFYFYHGGGRSLDLVQVYEPTLGESVESWLRGAANCFYYAVMAASVLAAPLWFSLRAPRKLLLVLVMLYYSFMFGFVFIGEPRFHAPLVPLLSIWAAVALASYLALGARAAGSAIGARRRSDDSSV
jgi:4-amino-4-deoxy-L-arabinose transferase-like glycosyltransferase